MIKGDCQWLFTPFIRSRHNSVEHERVHTKVRSLPRQHVHRLQDAGHGCVSFTERVRGGEKMSVPCIHRLFKKLRVRDDETIRGLDSTKVRQRNYFFSLILVSSVTFLAS